jgi:CheY-like chemotaxis protein
MNLKNIYIVIAEDDLDDGEFICESFVNHPSIKKVKWVKNGKELINLLSNDTGKKPDIILSDINMPLVNGIEALEEISKNSQLSSIPFFVYSSTLNPIYEKKCKSLGASGYLVKPFNFTDFKKIPSQIIESLNGKS